MRQSPPVAKHLTTVRTDQFAQRQSQKDERVRHPSGRRSDACFVDTIAFRSRQSARLPAQPPSNVTINSNTNTFAFPRTSLPVAGDARNHGTYGLGRFLDSIVCLVGMARFPHESMHHKMRSNAQQERGESRCIAPHTRKRSASEKKNRSRATPSQCNTPSFRNA